MTVLRSRLPSALPPARGHRRDLDHRHERHASSMRKKTPGSARTAGAVVHRLRRGRLRRALGAEESVYRFTFFALGATALRLSVVGLRRRPAEAETIATSLQGYPAVGAPATAPGRSALQAPRRQRTCCGEAALPGRATYPQTPRPASHPAGPRHAPPLRPCDRPGPRLAARCGEDARCARPHSGAAEYRSCSCRCNTNQGARRVDAIRLAWAT